MIYGEKLYRQRWYWGQKLECVFRYRLDPVPGIYKKTHRNFGNWYKTPKTVNEKRQVYGNEEYIRGRRNARNLPNPWDDYLRSDVRSRKTWKKRFKCRKQWEKHVK